MLLKNITERTLQNGLKVISLRKPDAPIVSVQTWYKVGSACEDDGIRGISHVLEHMMFRGSKQFGPEEHAHRINDVGGHCNAFTTEDVTVYMNSVPKESLDLVLELEADRMDCLRIDPGIFETERSVIIEEFHTYMNNPVAKAFLEFRQEFFRDHPYATSPLGTFQDLESLTADKVKDFYNTWYSPDNAVLVVVGDFDEQWLSELVDRHFGTKARGTEKKCRGFHNYPSEHFYKGHRMKRLVEFDVPLLIIGYPAPPSSHEDAVALEILQLVISGGESSRLHREVVRRESVAVMAGGMNHMLKNAGMSMFFAAFTPDVSPAKVEKSLHAQIQHIKSSGITAAEMEKVKNTTLTSRTFELYSAESICHRIGYSQCIEGDYRIWVERLDALKKLDMSKLVEVARCYWNDEHRHVLHLQPRKVNPLLFVGGLVRRFFGKHR